jgi:hypothetical protein
MNYKHPTLGFGLRTSQAAADFGLWTLDFELLKRRTQLGQLPIA